MQELQQPLPGVLVLGLHLLRSCLVQGRLLHSVLAQERQRQTQARRRQGRVLEPGRSWRREQLRQGRSCPDPWLTP